MAKHILTKMDKKRISYLFTKYVNKTASSIEKDELMRYIHTASDKEIISLLEASYQSQEEEADVFNSIQRVNMLKAILAGSRQEELAGKPIRQLRLRKPIWKFSAVAALLLISFAIAFFFYQDQIKSVDPNIVQQSLLKDILPGENKATLRLANGEVISLNDIHEGDIVEQHGVMVTKTEDGQLLYQVYATDDGSPSIDEVEVAYHTITTPKGGQYQVQLPDGTKVWLNAESSLTYPPQFAKSERRVELIGEGYFEVEWKESSPFIVQTENQSVRVLGTHFNINTYRDTPDTETTLLEGSIMIDYVSADKKEISKKLMPGEQAVLNKQRTLTVRKVDISTSVAWKNGLFYFENTPVEQVLAEFARWYNFDFEFEGDMPSINLWGSVYRNVNASEALEILHYFNLKYRLIKDVDKSEGWKIVVSNL